MVKFAVALAFLFMARFAFSAVQLKPVGEAEALNGKILYSKGKIYVEGRKGAYSPLSPKTKLQNAVGANLVPDMSTCKKTMAKADVPVATGESIALVQRGDVGNLKNATVAVVRKKTDVAANDMFQYAPLEVRVFEDKKMVASYALDFDAYPCALVLDNFTSKNEKQLALGWVSVGNGYTTGVTLLSLPQER